MAIVGKLHTAAHASRRPHSGPDTAAWLVTVGVIDDVGALFVVKTTVNDQTIGQM